MADHPAIVVIHHLEHLRTVYRAARATGRPLLALTAPGAAHYAGVLYLKKTAEIAAEAEGPAPVTVAIDCGDDPATALAAIRAGWTDLVFRGAPDVAAKIADIARQSGARLMPPNDGPAFDLDSAGDLSTWLDESRAGP